MKATEYPIVSKRLTEAREVRGMNCAQLAECLGLTRQAVYQYEKGVRSPSPEIVEKIARALNFPISRFYRVISDPPDAPLFFRSLASATKIARTRAKRKLEWVRNDIYGFLRQFIEFQPVNFPELDVPCDPLELTEEEIENLARDVRRFWGLRDGPIGDVVLLLENNGAVLVRQELGVRTLDAFSMRAPGDPTPFFVLGTDKGSAVRSRFNAAHELAHMLLHSHLRPSDVNKRDIHRVLESQANYFAGAFLLPPETFSNDLMAASLNGFANIKMRWRVAIGAMIKRARSLDIISSADETRLFIEYTKRGWKKHEPFDDEIVPERNRFLEQAFDLVLDAKLVTTNSIEAEMSMFAPDIEQAIGLPDGFLSDEMYSLQFPTLTLKKQDASDSDLKLG